MLSTLFRNPAIIWIAWLFKTWIVLHKHRGKALEIRLLARAINSSLGNYNVLNPYCSVINSQLGDYVYIGPKSDVHNCHIGSYTSIGPRTIIGLGTHPTDFLSSCPVFYSTSKQCLTSFSDKNHFKEAGKNSIGNDVWIGSNAIIVDNVVVGDGAIVAAGSVVTKDVPPYTIVGGVPAKPIRKRFSDEIISHLMELKWWEKDSDWIQKNIKTFQHPITSLDELPSTQI